MKHGPPSTGIISIIFINIINMYTRVERQTESDEKNRAPAVGVVADHPSVRDLQHLVPGVKGCVLRPVPFLRRTKFPFEQIRTPP